MNIQKELVDSFGTNSWLVSKFGEGLSHEVSTTTPQFRANSFNWVLGHIVVSRDRAIMLLGGEPILIAEETALYETGSDSLNPETAVALDRLLKAVVESQECLAGGLMAASDEEMTAIYDEERQQTIGDRLKGLHWHETYHVGQLEILRQVGGERDPFP